MLGNYSFLEFFFWLIFRVHSYVNTRTRRSMSNPSTGYIIHQEAGDAHCGRDAIPPIDE